MVAAAQSSATATYLIAGAHSDNGPDVAVYRLDNGNLSLVHTLADGEGGNREIVASDSALYVVSPDYTPTDVAIVHLDNPELLDIVPLEIKSGIDVDVLVAARPGADQPESLILSTFFDSEDGNFHIGDEWAVASIARGDRPRTFTISTGLSNIQFLGSVNDGVRYSLPTVWVKTDGVRQAAIRNIFYAPAPDWLVQQYSFQNGVAALAAASPHYIVLFPASTASPHTKLPSGMNVFDISTHSWRRLDVDAVAGASTIRLFGDWLTIGPQSAPDAHVPQSLRGSLRLVNLRTNIELSLAAPSLDSEVIDVSGNLITYRISNTLYTASFAGNRMLPGRSMLTNDIVRNVHWMTRAPVGAGH